MKYISRMPAQLLFTLLASITLLQSCQKDQDKQEEDDTPPLLIKIIDWEAANWNKDSVPEYSIEYTADRITKLNGKYNDRISFKYEEEVAADVFSSQSRIVRARDMYDGGGIGQDTARFLTKDYENISRYILTGGINSQNSTYLDLKYPLESGAFIYADNSGAIRPVKVTRNNAGDISGIEVYEDQSMTHLYAKTEVTYSNTDNKLSALNRNLSFIDPSCRYAEGRLLIDLHANTFPFSVHYQSKCVSAFTVTVYNPITHIGNEYPKQVNYEFNPQGYITKILIDNQPFKEFVYVE